MSCTRLTVFQAASFSSPSPSPNPSPATVAVMAAVVRVAAVRVVATVVVARVAVRAARLTVFQAASFSAPPASTCGATVRGTYGTPEAGRRTVYVPRHHYLCLRITLRMRLVRTVRRLRDVRVSIGEHDVQSVRVERGLLPLLAQPRHALRLVLLLRSLHSELVARLLALGELPGTGEVAGQ